MDIFSWIVGILFILIFLGNYIIVWWIIGSFLIVKFLVIPILKRFVFKKKKKETK